MWRSKVEIYWRDALIARMNEVTCKLLRTEKNGERTKETHPDALSTVFHYIEIITRIATNWLDLTEMNS